MCAVRTGNRSQEKHFYTFIYQNLHKPDFIHQHTIHTTRTHTQALKKAIKYFEGQEGMNTVGWALVAFTGAWGGLWSHQCQSRRMRKAINRTLGTVFGTLYNRSSLCMAPQHLPLALNQPPRARRAEPGQPAGLPCSQRAPPNSPSTLQGTRLRLGRFCRP